MTILLAGGARSVGSRESSNLHFIELDSGFELLKSHVLGFAKTILWS
jgi:hypothetical protein